MKKAPCIAVLGTGSDVGKSIIATALCRIFLKKGYRVAPFKAQNMSNNSGVTMEGLEMGRAQIVQAEAAGIPPHVDMNPILLKPTSDVGSQVVVLGTAVGNQKAAQYYEKKKALFETALSSLDRLRSEYDLIIIEGAGSCAEVNLMDHDIVNFKMAEAADAPVILVGDIHRGGIFAQLVGTLACLTQEKCDRIKGFIINRFRGDIGLFKDGVTYIEEKTQKKVLGVIPHLKDMAIECEDSVAIEKPQSITKGPFPDNAIAIINIPHIANFTDFDPLRHALKESVCYLNQPQDLTGFKAVILPGSKNTRYDLNWINDTGWRKEILAFYMDGGHILGICGGYQMMGDLISDPIGLEGTPGNTKGLGLLPIETTLKAPKVTTRTAFTYEGSRGLGYEIHMGETILKKGTPPLVSIQKRNEAACDDVDGTIDKTKKAMGTYIHGFFDSAPVLKQWLRHVGIGISAHPLKGVWEEKEMRYDRLAAHVQKFLDVTAIEDFITKKGN